MHFDNTTFVSDDNDDGDDIYVCIYSYYVIITSLLYTL